MGMLDNWFRELTAPIREIKSKIMGIKNVKDGLAGDIGRISRDLGIKPTPQAPEQKPADPNVKK